MPWLTIKCRLFKILKKKKNLLKREITPIINETFEKKNIFKRICNSLPVEIDLISVVFSDMFFMFVKKCENSNKFILKSILLVNRCSTQ